MVSEETKEKISQIALTCIRCRRCMKECLMLSRFAENPKALFAEYLEKGPENMDRHIAYSCNECSQCTLKCPKHLNLKAVFQSLKADYAAENQGIVPVEALLPSEAGQNRECSPEYCTTLTAGTGRSTHGPAKYMFVPGRFPADPILAHLRDALGEHNVDILPFTGEDHPGPEVLAVLEALPAQVLITACPSSFQMLRENLKNHRILFYWDLMQDLIGIPRVTNAAREKIRLQGTASLGEGFRWVLDQLDGQWADTLPGEDPDLETADKDCRKILGLLFGAPESPADSVPFPRQWEVPSENPDLASLRS